MFSIFESLKNTLNPQQKKTKSIRLFFVSLYPVCTYKLTKIITLLLQDICYKNS